MMKAESENLQISKNPLPSLKQLDIIYPLVQWIAIYATLDRGGVKISLPLHD